jgi:hypothetical protein
VNTTASECILADGTFPSCRFHFVSASVPGAVNGPTGDQIQLDPDGTFSDAAVKLGSLQRSGCTGQWDATTSTVTVACGGTDTTSTQYCEVKMVRAGATCN